MLYGRPEMALFKFGGLKIIRQTIKLSTPLVILHVQHFFYEFDYAIWYAQWT